MNSKKRQPIAALMDIIYIAVSKTAFKFLKKSNINNVKYIQDEKLQAERPGCLYSNK